MSDGRLLAAIGEGAASLMLCLSNNISPPTKHSKNYKKTSQTENPFSKIYIVHKHYSSYSKYKC